MSGPQSIPGLTASIGLTVSLLIAALAFRPPLAQPMLKPFRLEGYAQGTTWHLLYFAKDSLVAQAAIDHALEKVDSELSIYKPYSQISRFNNSTTGLRISPDFQTVVKKSLEVYRESNGIFDITVLPLAEAWGFGAKKPATLPDSASIHALLPYIGSSRIHLNGDSLAKDLPAIRIDVNGIAQGYTVDVLANLLEQKGITRYLVELGGELRLKGPRPDGQPLTVGIEAPPQNAFDPASMQRIVRLDSGALTTSGNYRKFYLSGSRKISHLIDPSTGFPFDNEMISVTVWAPDAITADGYDNVLMGLGLRRSFEFLKMHPEMQAFFIFTTPDGSVRDTATAGFYKFMKPQEKPR
jgi:thiamine biosynthesis lipoprotein